jgi:hypothetical protein
VLPNDWLGWLALGVLAPGGTAVARAAVGILDPSASAVEGRAPGFVPDEDVAALDRCWATWAPMSAPTSISALTTLPALSTDSIPPSAAPADGSLADPPDAGGPALSAAPLATALSAGRALVSGPGYAQFAAPEPPPATAPLPTMRPAAVGAAAAAGTGAHASMRVAPSSTVLAPASVEGTSVGHVSLLATGRAPPSLQQVAMQNYGQMGLRFEANAGQYDPQVQFASRGAGYSLYLTGQQAVLDLSQQVVEPGSAQPVVQGNVFRTVFVGANPNAAATGLNPLPGVSNYFVGSDPSQWHTNVANYSEVLYHGLYPGIDLVYYGNQEGQLEYDFIVAPGADPSAIHLAVQGAQSTSLDAAGDLVLHSAYGDVTEQAPILYQQVNGVRQPVSGSFVLGSAGQVGFHVGAYDHTQPLDVDPSLSYATFLGGNGTDSGNSIVVDGSGNAYVTGTTSSSNFPTTTGAYQTTFGGGTDVFVTKVNAAGTGWMFSTYIGGTASQTGNVLALDSSGNIYVTGQAQSGGVPVTSGAFQTSPNGMTDAFLVKLNSSGSAIVFGTYLGGSGTANEAGTGVAVDASGDAYVVGYTQASNFPTTAGAFQVTAGGGYDAFVTKFNASGSALVYSTYLRGSSAEQATGIAIDSSGDAYVSGWTSSSNFPVAGGYQMTEGGGKDAFAVELNSSGSGEVFGTFLGGSADDQANGIAIDGMGDIYVAGSTASTNFPTLNAYQSAPAGGTDGFVCEFAPGGASLVTSSYLGGSGNDQVNAIALDVQGDAYLRARRLPATSRP